MESCCLTMFSSPLRAISSTVKKQNSSTAYEINTLKRHVAVLDTKLETLLSSASSLQSTLDAVHATVSCKRMDDDDRYDRSGDLHDRGDDDESGVLVID
jgi:hypothetical protein